MNGSALRKFSYRKFRNEADRGLEVLLNRSKQELNDNLRGIFTRAAQIAVSHYSMIAKEDLISYKSRATIDRIDDQLTHLFYSSVSQLQNVFIRMSTQVYMLSLAAEAEAIGRALVKPVKYQVKSEKAYEQALWNQEGTLIADRILLSFNKIRRKLMGAIELSVIQEDSTREMLIRFLKALPSQRVVKRPKRVLKNIKEADREDNDDDISLPKTSFSVGVLDQAEWASILDSYRKEYVPEWRSPEFILNVADELGLDEEALADQGLLTYAIDLEQEMVDKFVRDTRAGQTDAAKQEGISDFMWIAVIDDKTDECCAWRDGLTSREIEARLSGDKKDDECKTIVPPAHFNCRCRMAPVLKDMPELEPSNMQEFEDWLKT